MDLFINLNLERSSKYYLILMDQAEPASLFYSFKEEGVPTQGGSIELLVRAASGRLCLWFGLLFDTLPDETKHQKRYKTHISS